MREERQEFKRWLRATFPEGYTIKDVAAELGVTPKTLSSILRADHDSFGNGFNLLRYLRFVGALRDPPPESPATSRLVSLEEKADQTLVGIGDILDLLRAAPGESDAGAPEASQ